MNLRSRLVFWIAARLGVAVRPRDTSSGQAG